MRNIWIVQYDHRHGTDAWLITSTKEPLIEDIVAMSDIDYEPDREETLVATLQDKPPDDMDQWLLENRPKNLLNVAELRILCIVLDAYAMEMENNEGTLTARVDMYHYDRENIFLNIEEDIKGGAMESRTATLPRTALAEKRSVHSILEQLIDK